jgi:hypothetical protein
MPSPEPIPINDAFVECFTRLLESHGDADPEAITDTVAREYGIPLESLNEAIAKQVPVVMVYAALVSPQRAIGASAMGAFIAGVAWEQSRAAK